MRRGRRVGARVKDFLLDLGSCALDLVAESFGESRGNFVLGNLRGEKKGQEDTGQVGIWSCGACRWYWREKSRDGV